MQEFYEKLGLHKKFDFSDKGMVAFSIGNEEPAIILKNISMFPEQEPIIWFEVENVLIEYDSMVKKGVEFRSEPYQIGTGLAVEFKDPFGNTLGITDYSKEKFNE